MIRSILSAAAILFVSSSAMAADPINLEWKADVGGTRSYTVKFGSEPTPAQSDAAAAIIKAVSLAEGYTLDGTAGSQPGKNKSERNFTIGYKKAGEKPVMTKAKFANMVAGTVKYEFEFTSKPDATAVNNAAEALAKYAYDVTSDEKEVKATSEISIDEKKATVTVKFTGGKFKFIK
ncbi:MAG TPA: hypothetical protein PKV72_01615 [Candidatus Peribacteria bacterium]|nr:hypothetical protein [Candidatus Peribacteria bacterium]